MEKTIKSLNIVAAALLIVNLGVELWDRFKPQKQKKEEKETVDDEDGPEEECDEEEQNSDFYTEAMAGIYIKQQKFEQALEIIRAISADNPKKSVYFAEQIRYLELLVRLNRNKK